MEIVLPFVFATDTDIPRRERVQYGTLASIFHSAVRKMSTFLGQLLMAFVEFVFGSFGGLLIQAAVGRASGTGGWRTNRSGWAV